MPINKEKSIDTSRLGENGIEITINGVHFSYGSFPILKGIDLSIDEPQLISILGPNGVGKSTLIRCLNKILTPTEGVVMIDDFDVQCIPVKELAKVMGYVPCASGTSFPITVTDAVLMGRFPHQKYGSLDHDLEIVYETLDSLGITDLSMRSINELSAGQLQKVMIAKGLAQQPRILLLDEPTANLDIRHQLNVTHLLRDISRNNGVIVMMICHDINIAAKYSDRIVLMSEGRVFKVGTPDEVITAENLEKVYGVKSIIVHDSGRPHAILRDDDDTPNGENRTS